MIFVGYGLATGLRRTAERAYKAVTAKLCAVPKIIEARMTRRSAAYLCLPLLLISGCTGRPVPLPLPPPSGATGSALSAACEGHDGWSDPAPPAKIATNLYYVGTCGITSLLLTSSKGHILIDGATLQAVPLILASIRQLGFQPRDVRYLLNSHEHVDHAGGLARLREATGARLLARAEARQVLESGTVDPADPQLGAITGFPGVAVDRVIEDRDTITVGDLLLRVHATPGHTRGSTSFSWRMCEAGAACRTYVYGDSLSAVSAEGFRFSSPSRARFALPRNFRQSRAAALRCPYHTASERQQSVCTARRPGAAGRLARLRGLCCWSPIEA